MEKIKILFIANTLQGGGVERAIITIIKNININKYNVSIICRQKTGELLNEVPKNVSIKFVTNYFVSNYFHKTPSVFSRILLINKLYNFFIRISYILYIKKYLKNEDKRLNNIMKDTFFDVGINNTGGANLTFFNDYKKHFKKSIVWINVDISKIKLDYNKEYLLNTLTNIDSYIFVSESSKLGFFKVFPAIEKNINSIIIHNPINIDRVKKLSNEYENLTYPNPVLLCVGRLNIAKRFDKMIKVHKQLINNGINNTLLILGEGELRKELTNQINNLGVSETCKLLGFKENPYKYMKHCDIFVLSSDYEAYPLVLAEAIILNKPIVATNVTGVSDVLENSKYGMIVETTIESLYLGIKEMINNENIRLKYNQNINNIKEFKFAKETIISQLTNHIENVLSKN